jgi:hypothetical protein
MGFDRIIPLGSWCRNAFQINRFKQEHNVKAISYPFDWTITPVKSIEKVFSDTFKESNVLQEYHKQLKWLQDPYSEIFFVEWHSPSVKHSREKFLHTFGHLKNLKGQENLIFIRWFSSETKYNLRGSETHEMISKFYGNDDISNYKTLHENIKKFIGTDKFKIIEVCSKHNDKKQLIHKETDEKFVFRFEINEPKNKLNKNEWSGCNNRWNQLLSIIGERYGLS